MRTPIRNGLTDDSTLQPLVRDGMQALKREHRNMIAADLRDAFSDSLDIDLAFKKGREQEHRWDYLMGHTPTQSIVGIEPHSAKNDEISTVIDKRKDAIDQLRGHLKPGVKVASWYWVASGRVFFMPFEKATVRLANSGITFIGKELLKKHLPVVVDTSNAKAGGGAKRVAAASTAGKGPKTGGRSRMPR